MEDIFICECQDVEHQIVIRDDKEGFVYASILLNKLPWYKRIKIGLKYIFGHRSETGAFDEFIFKPEDWKKINKISRILKREYDNVENCKEFNSNTNKEIIENYRNGFPINKLQKAEIDKWIETQEGMFQYEFTPTPVGIIGKVVNTITGEKFEFQSIS